MAIGFGFWYFGFLGFVGLVLIARRTRASAEGLTFKPFADLLPEYSVRSTFAWHTDMGMIDQSFGW